MADFTEGPFVEIGGTRQPSLLTSEGETPRFLYRIVSQQEYDTAQEKGFFSPGGFYGRHHASASPEAQYLEPESNVLLKITHSPEDEWYSKWAGDRVHGVSSKDIPFSRAEKITSGSSQDIRGFLENFKEPRSTDQSKLPAVIDAASVASQLARTQADDPRPKGKGSVFRGVGSLMRSRVFPLMQAVQMGYKLLPEDKQVAGDVLDYLKKTKTHELFGLKKSGLEYFKDLLGLSDKKPDEAAGQAVSSLTEDSLEASLPTTQFLVSEIKKAVPNAQFGLNKSHTQMGPSNYLHIKAPGKPKIEIRLSNHATGVRRTMDYFMHFPDYIPEKGKPEFGKISRESFDKRINKVIDFLQPKDPRFKAAGGFVDKPLYEDARMIR